MAGFDVQRLPRRVLRWSRREWPAAVAIAVLVVGNIWAYGVHGAAWRPASPVFLLALAAFLGGELFRWLVRRLRGSANAS